MQAQEENLKTLELTPDKFVITGSDLDFDPAIVRPNLNYWQDAWRRLKTNKVALISLILLIIISFMTIFGEFISGYRHEEVNSSIIKHWPSFQHWFGTDSLGRDLFARVWQGGRISIILGLVGAFIVTIIGSIYGGISGYYGGKIDTIMMRIIEILTTLPYLLLVILVSLYLGKGMISLIIAMSITGWCGMARMVRGQVLQIKEREYVLAAVALGATPWRIITKHLLTNTLGIIIVSITFSIPGFIFAEAFLSFIGLGVQAPDTSWGALAASAQGSLTFYSYQLFFPGVMISLTMLSFTLLGDGLRDALDPKLRK